MIVKTTTPTTTQFKPVIKRSSSLFSLDLVDRRFVWKQFFFVSYVRINKSLTDWHWNAKLLSNESLCTHIFRIIVNNLHLFEFFVFCISMTNDSRLNSNNILSAEQNNTQLNIHSFDSFLFILRSFVHFTTLPQNDIHLKMNRALIQLLQSTFYIHICVFFLRTCVQITRCVQWQRKYKVNAQATGKYMDEYHQKTSSLYLSFLYRCI